MILASGGRLLLPLPFLLLALAVVASAAGSRLCNKDSPLFECECSDCLTELVSVESTEWIRVALDECVPPLDEAKIRRKVAEWASQECNAGLNCGRLKRLEPRQIVIAGLDCVDQQLVFQLLALKNVSQDLSQTYFGTGIHSVTLTSRPAVAPRLFPFTLFVFLVVFGFLLLVFVFLYLTQCHVNWRRVALGQWRSDPYPRPRYTHAMLQKISHEIGI